jgi:hypothetical protein
VEGPACEFKQTGGLLTKDPGLTGMGGIDPRVN